MVKSAVFSFVGHVGEAKTQVVQVVTLTEGFITNVEVVDGLLYCRLSASSIGVDDKVKKKTTSFEF
jgi:chaperonin GroEL (HSP60 family)